ncbi:hypothetical protein D3C87_1452060 [compost metagenome]
MIALNTSIDDEYAGSSTCSCEFDVLEETVGAVRNTLDAPIVSLQIQNSGGFANRICIGNHVCDIRKYAAGWNQPHELHVLGHGQSHK